MQLPASHPLSHHGDHSAQILTVSSFNGYSGASMSRQFSNPLNSFNSFRQVSNLGPGAPRTTAFSEPQPGHRFHSSSVNAPPGYLMAQPQPGYSDVMAAINTLSANLTKLVAGQDETDKKIQKVANAVETSHALLSNNFATRFKKMADRVGKQEEPISALGDKLREIDYSLQELLERTRDPSADGQLPQMAIICVSG